jgi:hypothetical protein
LDAARRRRSRAAQGPTSAPQFVGWPPQLAAAQLSQVAVQLPTWACRVDAHWARHIGFFLQALSQAASVEAACWLQLAAAVAHEEGAAHDPPAPTPAPPSA